MAAWLAAKACQHDAFVAQAQPLANLANQSVLHHCRPGPVFEQLFKSLPIEGGQSQQDLTAAWSLEDFGRQFLRVSHELDLLARDAVQRDSANHLLSMASFEKVACVLSLLEAASVYATWAEFAGRADQALRAEKSAFFAIQLPDRDEDFQQLFASAFRGIFDNAAFGQHPRAVTCKKLKPSHFQTPASVLLEQPVRHKNVLSKAALQWILQFSGSFIALDEIGKSRNQVSAWAPQSAWNRRLEWDMHEARVPWLQNPGVVKVSSMMMFPAWLPVDRWVVGISGTSVVSVVEYSLLGMWPISATGSIESMKWSHKPIHFEEKCSAASLGNKCSGQGGCSIRSVCIPQFLLAAAIQASNVRNITLRPGSAARVPSGYMTILNRVDSGTTHEDSLLLTFLATHGGSHQAMLSAKDGVSSAHKLEWDHTTEIIHQASTRSLESEKLSASHGPSSSKGKQRRQRWKRRVHAEKPPQPHTKQSSVSLYSSITEVGPISMKWAQETALERHTAVLARFRVGHHTRPDKTFHHAWTMDRNRPIPLWAEVVDQTFIHTILTSGQNRSLHATGLEPDTWYGLWQIPDKLEPLAFLPVPSLALTPPRSKPDPPLAFVLSQFSRNTGVVTYSAKWSPPADTGGADLLAYALTWSESGKESLAEAVVLQHTRRQYQFDSMNGYAAMRCFIRAVSEVGVGEAARALPRTCPSCTMTDGPFETVSTGALYADRIRPFAKGRKTWP